MEQNSSSQQTHDKAFLARRLSVSAHCPWSRFREIYRNKIDGELLFILRRL